MNEEIQPQQSPAIIPAASPVVHKEGGNVAVTALVPQDVVPCQAALIEWAQRKIAELGSDANELRGAYQHALDKKWKSATFLRHAQKVEKRISFYEKILAALEHGYIIVPNFPVQAFLIRTDRKIPMRMLTNVSWSADLKQPDSGLPAGEGGYENPFPIVEHNTYRTPSATDPNKITHSQWASEWDDIDFPLSMSKPQIMEATTRAMALHIFDSIGILPAAKKEDPVIIGHINLHDSNSNRYVDKTVSFMIAWHLDTRVL